MRVFNCFSDPRRPMPTQELKARFIQPMLLRQVQSLPEGPNWAYEVKLDGYRALTFHGMRGQIGKIGRRVCLVF
jgi:ATP-dependent DNA ligase